MKLNKTTDYAIRVVVCLRKKGLLKSKLEISEEMDIPERYLALVLTRLKDAGIVDSIRGQNGGYTLKKEWYEIKIMDIIKTTEVSVNINTFTDTKDIVERQLKTYSHVQRYFKEVQSGIEENLSITIQDIINDY